jgi:hypothetical protein
MNVALDTHPLVGTTQVFAPDRPSMAHLPVEMSVIARPGDEVTVVKVFHDWNGVDGLTMCYVFVPATGYHTHFSPREMGITE